ncbi:putative ammonia monooxygenase [Magnetofaba australis IT-1]|uniref:Putative ammonia monooxygenase n=1 Tax=Magnetofaba australis IT-1 TaxID=1434232 RepID=A0A1Y2JZC1_9PROT|nr:putative ammonia monooxygenase [Magnetofaba australis IT-1]
MAGFILLSLPLPWLLGALTGCLVAALLGAPMAHPPRPLAEFLRSGMGLIIGSGFSPHILDLLTPYAISLSVLTPYVALLAAIGAWHYRRFGGMNALTAWIAAIPGGMTEMTLMGRDLGANLTQVALAHLMRILMLAFGLSFVYQWLLGIDLSRPDALGGVDIGKLSARNWGEMLALAVLGWQGAARLRLPGASVLGPMLLTATAQISGLTQIHLPWQVTGVAQWGVGVTIGCAFIGVTWRQVAHAARVTGVLMAGYGVLTAGFAWSVARLIGFSPWEALLALAPGGQAEMCIIAATAGLSVAYVGAHHLTRIFLIFTIAPIWLARQQRTALR